MKKLWLLILILAFGCAKQPSHSVSRYEMPERQVVTFAGVGDNLIHGSIFRDAEQPDGTYDFSKMYEGVKKEIMESDLAFINQETVLGGNELTLSGYPSFNSPTELAHDLYEAGFDLVNLATNHSLDRYSKGIRNEKAAFDKYDMVVDGVYRSQEEFDTIPVFTIHDITFSFLAYTYGTNGITPEHSYDVSYFDESQIREDVAAAQKISDIVIVSAHWGDENSFEINEFQKYYAQLFADLGVDVVIGTHPHVIQPIEWVTGVNGNQTLVVYSLGNFIGGMLDFNNQVGGMIRFDFVKQKDKIWIENVVWIPLMIHFEGNQGNIVDDRWNYKSYKLEDYTEELASRHVLNGYEGITITIDKIREVTQQVIDNKYLR